MKLAACIESIGLIGPGLSNWPQAADMLAGRAAYVPAGTVVPPPDNLPSAERRRTGTTVRLALAAGREAASASQHDITRLATVFAASGGDGQNCHAICETLAGEDRLLSPTRFHNSVHNAPAGYWSIAMHATASLNVLCAHDGSFAAGLLESLCQVAVDGVPSLLIAYDASYPEPLHSQRPIIDGFGVALVLAPVSDTPGTALPCITVTLIDAPATTLANPQLEALRAGNPAARALPLLEALAAQRSTKVVLDYLPGTGLGIEIAVPDIAGAAA
jgi:hypothetical protein